MGRREEASFAERKSGTTLLLGALVLVVLGADASVTAARGPAGDRTVVALRGRDEAGLRALLDAQQDPASPEYRHWLTPAEFGRRFGAPSKEQRRVERWLRARGCRVKRFAGRQQVACIRAHPGDVPATLQRTVEDVLDPAAPLELRFNSVVSDLEPRSLSPANSRFYFSPREYAAFFGFDGLQDTGVTGSGQTIGIVGSAGVDPDHIAVFRSRFGLPALRLEQTGENGPSSTLQLAQLESILDVTWAGAVAPDASVVLAVSPGTLVDAIADLVHRPDVSVLSLSVVLVPSPEARPYIRQARRLFRQAAAQGQTVLIASGDFGPLLEISPRRRGVDPFASSPFVTAVGGTTPSVSNPSNVVAYGKEVVWQDGAMASGGGRSRSPRPRWQRGHAVRTVPDVSLPASSVYPIFNPRPVTGPPGLQCCVAGTSASAPAWAGLVAMLNQQRGGRVGLLNPALYRLGRAQQKGGAVVFHDIVLGSTNVVLTPRLVRGFPAKLGYDLATGWGTPDVAALFAAFP